MEIGYVYMITSPNNKIYVGSTNNILKRKNDYKNLNCKNQRKLYNSFVKYGVENHNIELLWYGELKLSYKYERLYGNFYDVLNKKTGLTLKLPGYNDIKGVMSNETKLKISKSNSGKIRTKETRELLSKIFTGFKHTSESKIKIGISGQKKVLCTLTGKEFESIQEAAKYLNIRPNYLTRQLSGLRKNKTSFIYG